MPQKQSLLVDHLMQTASSVLVLLLTRLTPLLTLRLVQEPDAPTLELEHMTSERQTLHILQRM
jgi:hypothetical protein